MTNVRCIDTLSSVICFLEREGLLSTTKYKMKKLVAHFFLYISVIAILVCDTIIAIRTVNIARFNITTYMFIPTINLGAKALAILFNKACFTSVLNSLESTIFNTHSEVQNEYIQTVDKLAKGFLKILVGLAIAYVVISSLLPFVMNIETLIPSPTEMGKYGVVYKLFNFFMTVYLGSNVVCFDLLFMTLMGLCIAQQNILEQMLMNVYEEAKAISKEGRLSAQLTEMHILKRCVILHETINM